jgi:hypothetical protein
MTSLRALQILLAVASIIPLATGLPAVWRGLPRELASVPDYGHVDSEHRFRAAIWAGLGIGVWFVIPSIATETLFVRVVMGAIIFGGVARLWSLWRGRYRFGAWLVGPLVAELIVAPIVIAWQASLA